MASILNRGLKVWTDWNFCFNKIKYTVNMSKYWVTNIRQTNFLWFHFTISVLNKGLGISWISDLIPINSLLSWLIPPSPGIFCMFEPNQTMTLSGFRSVLPVQNPLRDVRRCSKQTNTPANENLPTIIIVLRRDRQSVYNSLSTFYLHKITNIHALYSLTAVSQYALHWDLLV